jgi:hypothetical protein
MATFFLGSQEDGPEEDQRLTDDSVAWFDADVAS